MNRSKCFADLEQRGLLGETLVGQGEKGARDQNPKGFTYFMAGGGVRGGTSYGETDDLGHEAVVKRHHIRDLHATNLHQMGLDPNKLSYFYGGLEQRLVGVTGAEPIAGII